MKKILFLIIVSAYLIPCYGQKYTNENAKYALNTFYFYNLAEHFYINDLFPPQMIKDENNRITGYEIRFTDKLPYAKYNLIISNDSIEGVITPNQGKVYFVWEDGKIISIKDFGQTYKVEYNKDNLPKEFIKKGLAAGYYRLQDVITYTDGKPTKITYYENNLATKTQWYRRTREFEYYKNGVCCKLTAYKTDKPNIPENISLKTTECLYTINDTTIISKLDWQETKTVYNSEGKVINQRDSSYKTNSVTDKYYFYHNQQIYKTEKYTYENNELQKKEVTILRVIPEIAKNAPEYEREKGTYIFNKNGEMVYESRNGMFRKKENGKWTEWKHFMF